MEGAPVAVSDTGPLIALHAVGLLGVLCARFREVVVPLTVWSELNALPGAPEPHTVSALNCVRLVPDLPVPSAFVGLDPGEQQALARALATPDTFILTDDGAARRAAREQGLRHTGTIGLIALAKHLGLCESARDRYVQLLTSRFRIDRRVVDGALMDLGEQALDD